MNLSGDLIDYFFGVFFFDCGGGGGTVRPAFLLGGEGTRLPSLMGPFFEDLGFDLSATTSSKVVVHEYRHTDDAD